ncbi:hypothetical protein SANTM175S_08805 [Streptomyces antimycoticus]
MGVFVFLPLVLPLTALPIARLAEQHLHPRTATRLLTLVGTVPYGVLHAVPGAADGRRHGTTAGQSAAGQLV